MPKIDVFLSAMLNTEKHIELPLITKGSEKGYWNYLSAQKSAVRLLATINNAFYNLNSTKEDNYTSQIDIDNYTILETKEKPVSKETESTFSARSTSRWLVAK